MRRARLASVAVILVAMGAILTTGCPRGGSDNPWAASGNKPKVLVSFAPLYSFAASVAGPDAEVKCLLTSTGPHTHGDASAREIELARGCDVLVVNGLGLDDEADGIAPKLEKVTGKPLNILNLGKKIDASWLREGECNHEHAAEGHDHEHGTDPHVWLSVRCAKRMVESIRDELKRLDPDHAAGYESRAGAYLKKLDQLEADGKAMLANKQERWILSFHESLNYFAETYGLKIAGVIEVDPGKEPTAGRMDEIIKKCQNPNKPVRVIAVEPQFSSQGAARSIRNTLLGKKIESEFADIDPLETSPEADLSADQYEAVMRKNLAELARVLR
ncbi:MAG TPA: metal ABC transporter substrate-binding protein [Gemmataceae bacterium]|jgi:ABC-type Zn uptake system ZnuABC Zn-binding protein ZnuA|nr:metal ABC transporter substrate-binding protein [Gemmataceae bacterium]